MFLQAKLITLFVLGLWFFIVPSALSEEVLPIPVPAGSSPLMEAELPNVDVPAVPKLNGVQNSPPFDLSEVRKCEFELKKRKIEFTVLDKITDPKGCLVERPLQLSGLSGGIALSGDIVARCGVVLALDNLISHVATPSAKQHLGKRLNEVKISTSYQCRTRNGVTGAKVSEHGFANGIDIIGFGFDDETVIAVSPKEDITSSEGLNTAKFQVAVRAGACAYFTTVLGPGSNAAHAEHFHFDLAYRKDGYRLCE